MQQVTLSDHTGDQIRQAASQREIDHVAAMAVHASALAAREQHAEALRTQSIIDWKTRRYFAWLGTLVRRIQHAQSPAPQPPRMPSLENREAVWLAGADGEQRVVNALGSFLPDTWTLLAGYQNRGGEADIVLVGPNVVIAMEVKYITGMIHCDGARWARDKYDRYGNRVQGNQPITDRTGRSPSDQINAVATHLRTHLSIHCPGTPVATAVVLAHPNVRIGHVRDLQVNLISTMDTLHFQIQRMLAVPSLRNHPGIDTELVVQKIRENHAANVAKREGTRRPRAETPATLHDTPEQLATPT